MNEQFSYGLLFIGGVLLVLVLIIGLVYLLKHIKNIPSQGKGNSKISPVREKAAAITLFVLISFFIIAFVISLLQF